MVGNIWLILFFNGKRYLKYVPTVLCPRHDGCVLLSLLLKGTFISLLGLLALEVTKGQQFTYSGDICYSPGIHRQLLHRDVSLRDKLYMMRREYTADTLATFRTESKNVKTFKSDTNWHVALHCRLYRQRNAVVYISKKVSSKLRAE